VTLWDRPWRYGTGRGLSHSWMGSMGNLSYCLFKMEIVSFPKIICMHRFIIFFTLIYISWGSLWAQDSESSKPNIIFIMADDLGFGDLGCYGQQVIQTPRIDRMAQEGIRFAQCYTGSPVCAPSRSVLMTGMHTGHTTVRGNFGKTGVVGLGGGKGRVPLKAEDYTVAEMMKNAGYVTGMTGKWGLGEPHTTGHPIVS